MLPVSLLKHRQKSPRRAGFCPKGGTCLCHGAVMDRHVTPPNPDCEMVTCLPLDAVLLIQGVFAGQRGFGTDQTACHFRAAASGRAVRALIASFLL